MVEWWVSHIFLAKHVKKKDLLTGALMGSLGQSSAQAQVPYGNQCFSDSLKGRTFYISHSLSFNVLASLIKMIWKEKCLPQSLCSLRTVS